MPRVLDYLSWWVIILFAVPTVFIMGSWNSLPGEPMYGVKQAFERGLLLAAKPSYAAQSRLSITHTERRFTEATILLSNKQSVEGLPYLEKQVGETKTVISKAPNKESQKQLARAYLATLKTGQSGLEQQKQALKSEISVLPTSSSPSPQEIVNEITDTQEQIEDVIKEIKDMMLQAESLFQEEKREEKKDQEKDKGDKDRGQSEEHRQDDKEKKDKEEDGDDKKND